MKKTWLALAAFVGAAFMTPAFGQHGPKQGEYSIDAIAINGSACPTGTRAQVSAIESSTLEGLLFSIEGFDVNTKTMPRGFCNIAINIKHPAGWSYGVSGLATALYADVLKGVRGGVVVTSDFRGTGAKTSGGRRVDGAYKGIVNINQFPSPVKFSPCGRNIPLNIKIDARLDGGSSSQEESFFSVLPYKRAIEQGLKINWRRC